MLQTPSNKDQESLGQKLNPSEQFGAITLQTLGNEIPFNAKVGFSSLRSSPSVVSTRVLLRAIAGISWATW